MRAHLPLLLLLSTTPFLHAEDWPQWFGPERNGHSAAGAAVPKALPTAIQPTWHIPVGFGLASPIVSNGKVIYLDNQNSKETVHLIDAATGKEVWNAILDEAFKDGQSLPGPRCTPATDGTLIFVQSCKGELKCLNFADGKEVWHTNFTTNFGAVFIGEKGTAVGAARHGNTGSPVIDGDRLYIQPGGKDSSVACLEKKTGKVLWKSESDVPGYAPIVLATIAGTKQAISFTADGVIGLDADSGKLLWRVPIKTQFGRHVTTPLVVDDVVIVSSHTSGLIGTKITKDGVAFKAEPAWPPKMESAINFSSPVAVGSNIFSLGKMKNVFCTDAKTGTQAWSKDGFGAFASFIVLDQNILVLSDKGELVLFAADAKAFKELGRVQACATNWCHPAYANGKLFLRDAKELWCIPLVP